MYIIGENIHIISDKVKEALKNRDREFFMDLASRQVEAGASAIDINLGPRKKDWDQVFPWMVETLETVVDVPLSFDSTNVLAIEAGLKSVTKAQPIVNSTSAEPERLEKVPPLAKKYNAKLKRYNNLKDINMAKSKELAFNEFLGTISVTERDRWVLQKIFASDKEKRTQTAWYKLLDTKATGVNYKKVN